MKKQQHLLYTIHPVLTDLKINENGTEIYWKGQPLKIKTYTSKKNNKTVTVVQFKNRTHSVPKLVCEAWHGMRKEDELALHKGDVNDHHFTNLYWGYSNSNEYKAKRSVLSKITIDDEPIILRHIANGKTLTEIALMYHTSAMSIYRVKKKHSA